MRFIFKFPDIGEGIHEGKILEWYVQKGQSVKAGQSIVKMETDKVVADIPSPKTGAITSLFGKIGETIHVDDPLIELELEASSGEEAQKIAQEKLPVSKNRQQPLEEKGFGVVGTLEVAGDGAYLPASEEGQEPSKNANSLDKKVLATPVARAMAKDLGVDVQQVLGTGPGGRITKKDIEDYFHRIPKRPRDITTMVFRKRATIPSNTLEKEKNLDSPSSCDSKIKAKMESSGLEIVPISQIRKTIAKRMVLSTQTAPHMTVFEEVEVSKLVELRKQQKDKFQERGIQLTYLPFIIKALTDGLKKHKALNSQINMEKEEITYKHYYNIGIAVDTNDGLVVPVIRDADQMSIAELASEIQNLAERARNRTLEIEDLREGTFSITNFGAIAGLHAVPIINYPEVAILGVGRIYKTPIIKGDSITIGYILPLSLSVDHRVVDGGEASRFMKDVMTALEDPISLCLG